MSVKYYLCPRCGAPVPIVPNREVVCPHCGAHLGVTGVTGSTLYPNNRMQYGYPLPNPPIFRSQTYTNPYSERSEGNPLLYRLLKAFYVDYKGVFISLAILSILLLNYLVLGMAIPLVQREAPVERNFSNTIYLDFPWMVDSLSNISNLEIWPSQNISRGGMILFNYTINDGKPFLPPTPVLKCYDDNKVIRPSLYFSKTPTGWIFHALFYPLLSPGNYSMHLLSKYSSSDLTEDIGVLYDHIKISPSSITYPPINSPVYNSGGSGAIKVSAYYKNYTAYLQGRNITLPLPFNTLNGEIRTLRLQIVNKRLDYLLLPFVKIDYKKSDLSLLSVIKDNFSSLNYSFPKNIVHGEIISLSYSPSGFWGYVPLPTLKVNNLKENLFAFKDNKMYTIFSTPLEGERMVLKILNNGKGCSSLTFNLSTGVAPLFSFISSPFLNNTSSIYNISLLRYTFENPSAVSLNGRLYPIPENGNSTFVNLSSIKATIVRHQNGTLSLLLRLSSDGAFISVGYLTTYHPSEDLFLLTPVPPFLTSLPISFSGEGLYFFFLFLFITISLSILFIGYETLKFMRAKGIYNLTALSQTPLTYLGLTFFASLFFSISVTYLMKLLSTPVTTPASFDIFPGWFLLVSLASASVYEEIISRFLIIGIPMFLIALVTGRRNLLRYLIGGYNHFDGATYFFILLSASLFSLAHSGGWGYWKVIPTFISGLLFGYLYVKVGLHGTILMHFATDYLGATGYLNYGGFSLLSSAIFILVLLFSYLYGIYFSGSFLNRMNDRNGTVLSEPLAISFYMFIPLSYAVILLFIFLKGGNIFSLVIFIILTGMILFLTVFSLILSRMGIHAKSLALITGGIGAFLSFPFAPLAVPYLNHIFRKLRG